MHDEGLTTPYLPVTPAFLVRFVICRVGTAVRSVKGGEAAGRECERAMEEGTAKCENRGARQKVESVPGEWSVTEAYTRSRFNAWAA